MVCVLGGNSLNFSYNQSKTLTQIFRISAGITAVTKNTVINQKTVSSSNSMGFQSQEKYNSCSTYPYHILE
jgi:hypothetical protein